MIDDDFPETRPELTGPTIPCPRCGFVIELPGLEQLLDPDGIPQRMAAVWCPECDTRIETKPEWWTNLPVDRRHLVADLRQALSWLPTLAVDHAVDLEHVISWAMRLEGLGRHELALAIRASAARPRELTALVERAIAAVEPR